MMLQVADLQALSLYNYQYRMSTFDTDEKILDVSLQEGRHKDEKSWRITHF
jgi:hypothetical protein